MIPQLSTRQQRLRGRAWTARSRGVAVPSGIVIDDRVRAEAALAAVPNAWLTGQSAVWAWTSGRVPLPDPVDLAVERQHRSRRPGVVCAALGRGAGYRAKGLPVPSPAMAGADVACRLPRLEALQCLDALCNVGVTSVADIAAQLRPPDGRRGAVAGRRLLAEVEPGAASVKETVLRLILVDGGLPRPVSQMRIATGAGEFLGWADLGYPELLLGVEFLGAVHRRYRTWADDQQRMNLASLAGHLMLCFTSGDLRYPDRVVATVGEARARQAARLGRRRDARS